jgi:Lysine-specific metallo-endopeptidase
VSNRGPTRVSARETDSGQGNPARFRSRGALDLTPEYLSAAALRMMTLKFERGNDPEAKIMDGYHRRSMIKGAFCSIATLSMGSIASNKVAFRTLDSGATLLPANCNDKNLTKPWISPIPKKPYPREPKVPVFQDQRGQEMPRQKIIDYSAAHRRAYKQIVASLKNLQEPYFSYGKWFDLTYDEERKKKVIANLARMANWMADYSVIFINTNDKCDERFNDKLAWTHINPPLGPIHLCWRAFDDFWLLSEGGLEGKDWARAFIVIHEVSHAAAQTCDVSRNWLYCNSDLMSPDNKVRNAQNYALFAMEADTSRFAYVPEGEIDLKTGDKIQLIANNGQFVATKYEHPHYLVTDPHMPNEFTVTVDDKEPSTISLHESLHNTGDLYLPDGTQSIACMPAANIPNDRWRRFKAGEFEVYKGTDQNGQIKTEKLLVLQARNGKLLWLNNENFIVADSRDVDQRCLFKLIKVRG